MDEWRCKREVMELYDLTAHMYDMRYAEEQALKMKKALNAVRLDHTSLVLDVGCGSGLLFDHIADKVSWIVGVDISKRLLIEAKKRAEKLGNVHLILADADHVPIISGCFTHLFAVTVLQNLPNPKKTLMEAKRVTAENAIIVVTGLKKKFPKDFFIALLQQAGFNVRTMTDEGEALKCYVAICSKN